jgi:hypothetical protein
MWNIVQPEVERTATAVHCRMKKADRIFKVGHQLLRDWQVRLPNEALSLGVNLGMAQHSCDPKSLDGLLEVTLTQPGIDQLLHMWDIPQNVGVKV